MRLAPSLVRSRFGLAAFAIATAGIGTITTNAAADEKQACLAASEQAQRLRSAGKLSEARDQLGICGRVECPKLVQQDCTQWMSEVLASMPSIVLGAKDGNGRDIIDVRLSVDGKVATEKFDGKPIVLDPGVHTFVFETNGAPAIKDQYVVKPGEKNRLISVTFKSDEGPTPVEGGGPITQPPDEAKPSLPIAAFVVGGLGVVAGGIALAMDLSTSGDARDLRSSGCAPRCAQSDVDDLQARYTVAGVTAGIGAALLVTGVVLFVLHQRGERAQTSESARWIQPGLGRASGSAAVLRF
jgi:hypothetical protein